MNLNLISPPSLSVKTPAVSFRSSGSDPVTASYTTAPVRFGGIDPFDSLPAKLLFNALLFPQKILNMVSGGRLCKDAKGASFLPLWKPKNKN